MPLPGVWWLAGATSFIGVQASRMGSGLVFLTVAPAVSLQVTLSSPTHSPMSCHLSLPQAPYQSDFLKPLCTNSNPTPPSLPIFPWIPLCCQTAWKRCLSSLHLQPRSAERAEMWPDPFSSTSPGSASICYCHSLWERAHFIGKQNE